MAAIKTKSAKRTTVKKAAAPKKAKVASKKAERKQAEPKKAAPKTTSGATGFDGFADAKCSFFHELAKKQDRAWFAAHKHEFKEGYEQPMTALLEEARDRIASAYPDQPLAPPKVFRIHRDV